MFDQDKFMIIKHFYIALSDDDFLIKNPEESEFPYRNDPIVADFNFQTDYFSSYIEREVKKQKLDAGNFNMIMIRGRKNPRPIPFIEEHHKCLTIEVFFDYKVYKRIYPHINEYPLEGLLNPLGNKDEFSTFLMSMVLDAMEIAEKENINLPSQFIVDTVLDFKKLRFQNNWIYKKKTIPRTELTSKLACELTVNYFKLNLIIENKAREVIYEETILTTLPSSIQYKSEFKDMVYRDGYIIVLKENGESLHKIDLDSLKAINC